MNTINKYGLKFDNNRIGQLVKEDTYAYDMGSCIIDSAEKAAELIELVFDGSNLPEERFFLIALNSARKVSGIFEVSHGTLMCSLVHPREIFTRAILAGAASIIIAHNHPSGALDISENDREVSRRIRKAGDIIGIRLDDHVVIADGEFVSAY